MESNYIRGLGVLLLNCRGDLIGYCVYFSKILLSSTELGFCGNLIAYKGISLQAKIVDVTVQDRDDL